MSIRKRLDGIVKIPSDYLSETPPIPKSVKIELSPKCNYHCAYCGYSFRPDKRGDMNWDLFKRIVTELKILGVEEIGVFYIGESFINPPLLIKAVRFLKKNLEFPYVFLTSNASLAKPKTTRALMNIGLDSLKWSCNASSDEEFKKMMGVGSVWLDLAKDNIKSAWELRKEFHANTKLYASSIMYDKDQPEKAKPFLEKYVLPYIDEHYWLPLYTMGGVANEKEEELGLQPVAGNPGRCDSPVEPIPCWTLFTAGHILSDGRLTGCCMDATGKWVMGDLKKQSFRDAWHSEDFRKLRKAHIDKNILGTACEKCALVGG